MLGTPESEHLKVTALNLFHPTASPPLQNVSFFIVTQPLDGGGLRRGWQSEFGLDLVPPPLHPLPQRGAEFLLRIYFENFRDEFL